MGVSKIKVGFYRVTVSGVESFTRYRSTAVGAGILARRCHTNGSRVRVNQRTTDGWVDVDWSALPAEVPHRDLSAELTETLVLDESFARYRSFARWGSVRFSWTPVARFMSREAGVLSLPIKAMARQLRINPRQIHRWRHGGICADSADRIADALGVTGGEIWPDYYDVLCGDESTWDEVA